MEDSSIKTSLIQKLKIHFSKQMDLTQDHLFSNFIIFTIPIVLLSLLQLLYNTADLLVVDYFGGGYKSFVAVSSNGALINLIIGLFVGIGVGANVVLANAKGSLNKEKGSNTLHSALGISVVFGIAIAIFGYYMSPVILSWMSVGEEVFYLAVDYLQIYFIGVPFLLVFNFGSALLRAMGDSKRPLYALLICGIINVGLNFLFVTVFELDVKGVALATIISEFIQAALVIFFLAHDKDSFVNFKFKKLFRFYPNETKEILINGIPAGVQSLVFSLSNIFIQSSVNSFLYTAMAGNSASSQWEGYVYHVLNGFGVAVVAIVAQNYSKGNEKNLRKIIWYSLATVLTVGLILGVFSVIFRENIIHIFLNTNSVETEAELQEAFDYGCLRLTIICSTYFLCGFMDTEAAYCRGLGHSVTPTIISLFGACLLRIIFILTLFNHVEYFHTLFWLWLTWPISWVITDLMYLFFIPKYRKEAFRKINARKINMEIKEAV